MLKVIDIYSNKRWFPAIFVAAGILSALVLQHGLGWVPCPLCILQRLSSIGLLVSLVALTQTKKGSVSRAVVLGAASLITAAGLAAAGSHLMLLAAPEASSCGPGLALFVAQLVDRIPGSAWLLDGSGPCEEARYALLGIPLPALSALLHITGFLGGIFLARKMPATE